MMFIYIVAYFTLKGFMERQVSFFAAQCNGWKHFIAPTQQPALQKHAITQEDTHTYTNTAEAIYTHTHLPHGNPYTVLQEAELMQIATHVTIYILGLLKISS